MHLNGRGWRGNIEPECLINDHLGLFSSQKCHQNTGKSYLIFKQFIRFDFNFLKSFRELILHQLPMVKAVFSDCFEDLGDLLGELCSGCQPTLLKTHHINYQISHEKIKLTHEAMPLADSIN